MMLLLRLGPVEDRQSAVKRKTGSRGRRLEKEILNPGE